MTATGANSCAATYTVTNQWTGGFQAEVAIRNTGPGALSGWRATWAFANGQTITQLWNGSFTASGSTIAVVNAGYNGTVAVNGTTTFGLLGSWNGTNAAPVVTCAAT